MAQTLSNPELFSPPDLPGKTYHWLGPIVTENSGRTIRRVYKAITDPLKLSEAEVAKIQPVATVIITSSQDKTQYPDAPDYMTHFPNPGSRQERQKLQEIITDLDPLSGSLLQPRNS